MLDKFIQVKNDTIINSNDILRLDRWNIRNSEYTRWEKEYENTMNDVINMYIEKHPEALMSQKTDSEIISDLRKKFDKHVRNQLGSIEPNEIKYSILTRSRKIIYISKDVYYELCNKLNINMNTEYDEFFNTEETLNEEYNNVEFV